VWKAAPKENLKYKSATLNFLTKAVDYFLKDEINENSLFADRQLICV